MEQRAYTFPEQRNSLLAPCPPDLLNSGHHPMLRSPTRWREPGLLACASGKTSIDGIWCFSRTKDGIDNDNLGSRPVLTKMADQGYGVSLHFRQQGMQPMVDKKLACSFCGLLVPLRDGRSCTLASCPVATEKREQDAELRVMKQNSRCSFCELPLARPLKVTCALASCPVLENISRPASPFAGQVNNTPELDDMSGQEFEIFVRDQLLRKGFETIDTTPGSGDMGADLIVCHHGKKIVIQCKRSRNSIGVAAVQEVLGAKCFYGAQEAWVVTNAMFTEAARSLARIAKVRLKIVKARISGS